MASFSLLTIILTLVLKSSLSIPSLYILNTSVMSNIYFDDFAMKQQGLKCLRF